MQALADFDIAVGTAPKLHRLGDKAFASAHEYRGLFFEGLDCLVRHTQGHSQVFRRYLHRHEQPRAPGTPRVVEGDANAGGTGLLAEQAADMSNPPFHLLAQFAGDNVHGHARTDFTQVPRRHAERSPDPRQVGQGEGCAGFIDDLPRH
ncbi:hypothetical protein D3C78_1020260 [compost metagenome]